MKVKLTLAAALALILSAPAFAQSDGDVRNLALSSNGTGGGLSYTEVNEGFDTGARLSGGIDWAIIPKQLHLTFDEELRIKDNFSNVNKAYTNLGLEYKLLKGLKAEASYSFIMSKNSSDVWRARHRGALSLTASTKLGNWRFSLKEKLQATYKAYDVNLFQAPQTDLALKSRVKVSYKPVYSKWEPYFAVEIRNTLNAVNPDSFVYGTYTWQKYTDSSWEDKSRTCYGNLSPAYNDIYINRLRFNLGTDWKFERNQTLTMYVVIDCNYDMPIDFGSKGIQKSYSNYVADNASTTVSEASYYKYGVGIVTLEDSYFVGLGLAYTFAL